MCPLCEEEEKKIRIKSHVIPRFIVKQTKEDGLNVYIGSKKIKEKNFYDIKAKIVCDDCEKRFKEDDDFAKRFFDLNEFYQKGYSYQPNNPKLKIAGYETYKISSYKPLKKFVFSVILRHHLYLKKTESKNFLGPHFATMRDMYLNNDISASKYPTCMLRYVDFSSVGYPTKEKSGGLNTIFMILKGYRVWTYIDSRHTMEKAFEPFNIGPRHVRALTLSIQNSKFQKDLLKTVKQKM